MDTTLSQVFVIKGKDVQFIYSSIYRIFCQQLSDHLSPSTTQIVLGYSGGLDSELMASCLAEFARTNPQYQYLLVHVHHGLHPEADLWVEHCQQRSQVYQLPIHVERVEIPFRSRTSLEAQAREKRYQIFEQLMVQPSGLLLTAHHADDQLETMLLALKRGCGMQGFSGMKTATPQATGHLILRPFLTCTRAELAACVQSFQLPYIEDSSNQDQTFDRNFLRQGPIAAMQHRWPHLSHHAQRLTEHMHEQLQLLEVLLDQHLTAMVDDTGSLCCLQLKEQSKTMQQHLLRRFLQKQHALMPTAAQLEQMLQQAHKAGTESQMCVSWGAWQLRCYQQRLYLLEQISEEVLQPIKISLQDGQKLVLPDAHYQIRFGQGAFVMQACLDQSTLRIQFGAPNALMCHPHHRQHRRSYKKLMQELKIPPWERLRVPLLFAGDRIIAAIGLWVEQSVLAQSGDDGWFFAPEVIEKLD